MLRAFLSFVRQSSRLLNMKLGGVKETLGIARWSELWGILDLQLASEVGGSLWDYAFNLEIRG
jgi:hypothetical protein